jgi:hypothetical protein
MFWLLRVMSWVMGSRMMVAVLGLAIAIQAWLLLRVQPIALDARQLELADEVAHKLAESLPRPTAGRPTLVVMPFDRDPTGGVTEAVRRAIARVDHYTVQPPGLQERLITRCGFALTTVSFASAEQLDTAGLGGEYVLLGQVQILSARSDRDEAVLEGILIPARSSADSRRSQRVADSADSMRGPAGPQAPSRVLRVKGEAVHEHRPVTMASGLAAWCQPARLVAWLVFVLCLPLAVARPIQHALNRESNGLNLLMLLGLTTAAWSAAWAVIGRSAETGVGTALLVLTLAAAFGYNWWVLSRLEHLRS